MPTIMELTPLPSQNPDNACQNELDALPIDEIDTTQAQDKTEMLYSANDVLMDITSIMSDNSNEGISDTAAEIAEIAIESLIDRLGMKKQSVFVTTEQFRSAKTRTLATRISLEGIFEYLREIWEHIKQAAIKMWEVIERFFDKLVKVAFGHETMARSDKQIAEIKELLQAEKEGRIDMSNVSTEGFESDAIFTNKRISEPFVNIDPKPTFHTVKTLCGNIEDNILYSNGVTEAYLKLISEVHPLANKIAKDILSVVEDNSKILNLNTGDQIDYLVSQTVDRAIEINFPEVTSVEVERNVHPPLNYQRLLKLRGSEKMAYGDQIILQLEKDDSDQKKHYELAYCKPPQRLPVEMAIPSLSDLNNLAMHLKTTKQRFTETTHSDIEKLRKAKTTDAEIISRIIAAVDRLDEFGKGVEKETRQDVGKALRALQVMTSRNMRLISGFSTHYFRDLQVSLEAVDRYVQSSIYFYKQRRTAQKAA